MFTGLSRKRSGKINKEKCLGSEYLAQRFNRPVDENGQKKFDQFFYPLGKIFGQILGFGGDKIKKFPMEKNKANLGPNWPKSAICVMQNLQNEGG